MLGKLHLYRTCVALREGAPKAFPAQGDGDNNARTPRNIYIRWLIAVSSWDFVKQKLGFFKHKIRTFLPLIIIMHCIHSHSITIPISNRTEWDEKDGRRVWYFCGFPTHNSFYFHSSWEIFSGRVTKLFKLENWKRSQRKLFPLTRQAQTSNNFRGWIWHFPHITNKFQLFVFFQGNSFPIGAHYYIAWKENGAKSYFVQICRGISTLLLFHTLPILIIITRHVT